jgi:hypothetical protein
MVGRVLVALLRAPTLGDRDITGWTGEAALRTWARTGEPIPDLEIRWRRHATDSVSSNERSNDGRWHVECDRATQSRGVWGRKLARYLAFRPGEPVLVVTTSEERAHNLADLANKAGVPLRATTMGALEDEPTGALRLLR